MFDALTMFSDEQVATATADSTKVIDLGQERPDLGKMPLSIEVIANEKFAGGTNPKLTIDLQHADDDGTGKAGTFATVLSTGAMDATKLTVMNVKIPASHKRYLKLKYTVTGSPTAGKLTAGIVAYGSQDNPLRKRTDI